MPLFSRYVQVPVSDEDISDGNNSVPETPEHVSAHQSSNTSGMRQTEDEMPLLQNGSNQDAPPEYPANEIAASESSSNQSGGDRVGQYAPPKLDMTAPPPYSEYESQYPGSIVVNIDGEVANGNVQVPEGSTMEPPSYEEVQRIKAVEAQLENGDHILLPPHSTGLNIGVLPMGDSPACSESGSEARAVEEDLLGTDTLFFLAFAAAFVFNWAGFVVLVCFCHSVAGRSGALAGFGLSLAKWAVIVRHSSTLSAQANTYLLYLIIVLGLAICMRAVLQYLNAKREWHHASAAARHRFLLFH